MIECTFARYGSEADARQAPRRHGRAEVYRCPVCSHWHSQRSVTCRRCGIPLIVGVGTVPVDPRKGEFHPRDCPRTAAA